VALVNPKELAAKIIQSWNSEPLVACTTTKAAAAALDASAVERLVEVAYEASMLQDEGRPVSLRMLLHPAANFDVWQGPPEGLQRLIFTDPRPYNARELRRISPAASYYRSLVGVEGQTAKELKIWGLVQSGPRWLQNMQGGRGAAPPLPDCLVVGATRAGCLDISRGSRRLFSVRAGHPSTASMDVFQSKWLPGRFASIRAELLALHAEARSAQSHSWAPLEADLTRQIGQHMIKRLITTIRNSHHGGSLILVPTERVEELSSPSAPLKFKYRFVDDPASKRFRRLIVNIMNSLAALGTSLALSPGESIGWKHYNELGHRELAVLDEGIFEISHLVAQLASVDGAIALSTRFELLGFGVEIASSLPDVLSVRRALDLEGERFEEEDSDGVGTRHRSAYRLCSAARDALVIVVSQDGGVSFVSWKDEGVMVWPHEIHAPMSE
jgi:hypothetical protein